MLATLLATLGWCYIFALCFIIGYVWRARTHRCIDVHDLDAAYRRGFQDGLDDARRARHADADGLERAWRIS